MTCDNQVFYVHEDDNCYAVKVTIAPSDERMKFAVRQFEHQHNVKHTSLDFSAIFYPFQYSMKIEHDGEMLTYFGDIFLYMDKLYYNTIAHECLHAALYHERTYVGYTGTWEETGPGYNHEERLAYKMDNYLRNIIRYCKKHRLTIKAE